MSHNAINPAEIEASHPELQQLRGKRVLVKYGGAAMEDSATKQLVCSEVAALARLGIEIVVVHGGGKEISRLLERLGLPSRFIDGLRVTDDETMVATEMALSGTINSDLVSRITGAGAPAIGLSGRDAGLLRAIKLRSKRGEDLGRTGEVQSSDPSAVEVVLRGGFVPVISPVGEASDGSALNLNADYAAAALSGSVRAACCVFLTDVPGVKREGEVIPRLTPALIAELIEVGAISGGMIPKVECAARALQVGCPRAVIAHAAQRMAITRALLGAADCGSEVSES
jgi:acetylglutamate kinase